jgi:ribose 5-phosphate isomerase A
MREGRAYTTDNGNSILDCRFAHGITQAAELEASIARIPGAVESGLFVGLAHALVIGEDDGRVEVRHKNL